MTELIWEGKYKDGKKVAPVRIPLPFQTIETVNESAKDRQRTLDMFAQGRPTEWRNRLVWGDKKYILPSLLPEFAGKVNLIYIDPPFDTGADFSFTASIGNHPDDEGDESSKFVKQPSIIEQKAYRDTWGVSALERAAGKTHLDRYLQWFFETTVMLKELLTTDGSVYVHLDPNVSQYAKVILDEVFGTENFRAEIIWKRATKLTNLRNYGIEHDTLFFYSNSTEFKFFQQFKPLKEQDVLSKYIYLDLPDGTITSLTKPQRLGLVSAPKGRRFRAVPLTNMNPNRPNLKYEFRGIVKVWATTKERMLELDKEGRIFQMKKGDVPSKKQYLDEVEGVKTNDVWEDIPPVNSQALERTGYATQKPEALLERIMRTSTDEGDFVLDCFCGSGTTAAVAERINRRWIACDLGRFAIHTTRKRLLGLAGVKPFVVQNLGKYERQAWQASEFANPDGRATQETAYRQFIVDLYHAKPMKGFNWLHGEKSGRMVHVGAVDSPVSLGDVKSIIQEFWKSVGKTKALKTNGVDILGWEFAFDINETARQQAAASNVDVKFKKIPRDAMDKRAVEQGDIHFFELAGLEMKAKVKVKRVELALREFVIPPDDVPEEVRSSISHWSQWVDYWAVDWNYRDDTFHNEWQSYRTKNEPKILLETSHVYEEKGSYQVVVKVIDILGNDTTKAITVKVS